MARPKKSNEEVMLDIPCKVPPAILEEIESLALQLERSKSFMARKFLLRGLVAYRRDGLLDEPGDGVTARRQPEQPVLENNHYLMSDPKGRNAGTKRLPLAIRKDIEDARAAVEKAKRK